MGDSPKQSPAPAGEPTSSTEDDGGDVTALDDPVERASFQRTRTLTGTFEIDATLGAITEIVESNGKSGAIRWVVTDFVPMALWEVHGPPSNRVFLDAARIEIEVRVTATFAASHNQT